MTPVIDHVGGHQVRRKPRGSRRRYLSRIHAAYRPTELICAQGLITVGVWIVDLISVTALVPLLSKIFSGTTGKTGEQLWDSLTSVVRRLFGRRSTSVEAVKRLGERPGDPDSIKALAQALVTDADRDPQAAAQLRHWLVTAERAIAEDEHVTNIVTNTVTNTVTGDVRGNIFQARDIHGNITF